MMISRSPAGVLDIESLGLFVCIVLLVCLQL